MMKVMAVLLAMLLGLIGGTGNAERNYQKEISQIQVYHSGFGVRTVEYWINLENGRLFEVFSGECEPLFIKDLGNDEIQVFLRESARFGLTQWEERYVDPGICDGHQWGITIYFADGEKMESRGSNAYPETWDDMNAAFNELTGENVLLYKSDWLD